MKSLDRFLRILVVGAIAALGAGSWVSDAQAQFIDEEPVGRLTIGGIIGAQFPGMKDINDNISTVNRFLTIEEVRRMDDVNVALVTGLDVRYKFSDRFSLALTWGALNARSEFDVTRADMRFYSRATTYGANLLYHFPGVVEFNDRLQVYAGGGFMLLQNGLVEWQAIDNTTNFFLEEGNLSEMSGKGTATGSGSGLNLMVGGSFQMGARFSAAVDFGYRFGSLNNLELNDSEFEGLFERFGLGDPDDGEDEIIREPGDWAVYDFFLRDPNSTSFDGRKRTDPREDGLEQTGCGDCPLYYTGGPIEVDYSGPYAQFSFRIHF